MSDDVSTTTTTTTTTVPAISQMRAFKVKTEEEEERADNKKSKVSDSTSDDRDGTSRDKLPTKGEMMSDVFKNLSKKTTSTWQKGQLGVIWQDLGAGRIKGSQLIRACDSIFGKGVFMKTVNETCPSWREISAGASYAREQCRNTTNASTGVDEVEKALKEARALLERNTAVLKRLTAMIEKMQSEKIGRR